MPSAPKPQVNIVDQLYEAQKRANPAAEQEKTKDEERLEEPPLPDKLRPWREVAQPHPDVLEARFTDAEFAANLAHVDQGIGSEEYTDPLAFFRITYLTEGLSRVLRTAAERFAKKGGDPVVGLRTNFGGGKTHTMLALYHLAGAVKAGYQPATLHRRDEATINCARPVPSSPFGLRDLNGGSSAIEPEPSTRGRARRRSAASACKSQA